MAATVGRMAMLGVETMPQSSGRLQSLNANEWTQRVWRLHDALKICPTDLNARCDLAMLLEELGELEGALFNWRQTLAYDPNNLKAWEGIGRCREGLRQRNPKT